MNNELLTVLSYLEREKGISRDVLVKAIENALQNAAKKSLGTSRDVRVSITLASPRGASAPVAMQRSSRQVASAVRRALLV